MFDWHRSPRRAVTFAAPAAAQQAAPTRATALEIKELEDGFVVAPDVRFSQVNDRTATLAGVYGGWLTDRTLLVGGGAYWLTNRDDDLKMQYAGGLVRWTVGGHRRVGVSAGALVGVGDATLSRTYGDVLGIPVGTAISNFARFGDSRNHRGPGQIVTSDTRVRISDNFFVAEPQVNALWNITPWMRLDVGVGYRFIGAADLLDDELRGPSGSIAFQFGGR